MTVQNEKVKKTREIQAGRSRQRIYEAAIALITDQGFDETSISEICKKAQCSVGAFYHYFPSKDSILEETFRIADKDFEGWKNYAGETYAGRELILSYMNSYADLVVKTGLDFSKRFYNCKNKIFIRKGRSMQTCLIDIISRAVASGNIKMTLSPEEAGEWLFLSARGIVFHWCLCEGNFDLAVKMQEGMKRVLTGIESRG